MTGRKNRALQVPPVVPYTSAWVRNTIKLTSDDRHIVIGCTFSSLLLGVWSSILLYRVLLSLSLPCENHGRAKSWARPQETTRPFFLAVYAQSRSVDGISETDTTRSLIHSIQSLPYGYFSCWVFLGWFPFDFKTAPVGGSRIFHIFNLKNERKKTLCTAG